MLHVKMTHVSFQQMALITVAVQMSRNSLLSKQTSQIQTKWLVTHDLSSYASFQFILKPDADL
jgi:hypothetical protein